MHPQLSNGRGNRTGSYYHEKTAESQSLNFRVILAPPYHPIIRHIAITSAAIILIWPYR